MKRLSLLLLACLTSCLVSYFFLASGHAQARQYDTCTASITLIKPSALPSEARQTLMLIRQGGPFPYRRDGVVFQNREKCLPRQRKGYYHEYTVPTPDSRDRGARRIITGEPEEYYYTEDHYRSFQRIQTP